LTYMCKSLSEAKINSTLNLVVCQCAVHVHYTIATPRGI
jgi:hypothetical protein